MHDILTHSFIGHRPRSEGGRLNVSMYIFLPCMHLTILLLPNACNASPDVWSVDTFRALVPLCFRVFVFLNF